MHRADIALVSCVKSKGPRAAPAQDLYVSTLFTGLRQYAQQHSKSWFILSAGHGLLHPKQVVQPYERTLFTMRKAERLAWAEGVKKELAPIIDAHRNTVEVLVLAGNRYREFIEPFLVDRGCKVIVPLQGLGIGEQLRWLKRANV
jgi:hypothetical protein